jgi:hypothetical protein
MRCFISVATSIANGYAGAFLQFIIGVIFIGVSCIFIVARNFGESGLVL